MAVSSCIDLKAGDHAAMWPERDTGQSPDMEMALDQLAHAGWGRPYKSINAVLLIMEAVKKSYPSMKSVANALRSGLPITVLGISDAKIMCLGFL